MQRKPIPALTGLRFFAAFHVVWYHYAPPLPHWPMNIVRNGYMAVSLFFVLSGFVLAYNYEGRRMDRSRFWLARFARIYPGYLLGFCLIAPAVAVRLLHSDPLRFVAAGAAAGALLQGWYPSLALVWNGPGWSLSNEAFFYLLFPMLLPALCRLSNRALAVAALACSAAAPLPMAAESLLSHTAWTSFIPLFRLPEFILGVLAGLFFIRGVRLDRYLPYASGGLAAFAVFSPEWLPEAVRPGLAAPLFAIFIHALAATDGRLSRVLGGKPLCPLGDASYSLYILQSPVMAFFIAATQGVHAAGARGPLTWTHFWLYEVVLLACALGSYRWVETPVRRWIMACRSGGRIGASPAAGAGSNLDFTEAEKRGRSPLPLMQH